METGANLPARVGPPPPEEIARLRRVVAGASPLFVALLLFRGLLLLPVKTRVMFIAGWLWADVRRALRAHRERLDSIRAILKGQAERVEAARAKRERAGQERNKTQ